jgi:hypothetical protein
MVRWRQQAQAAAASMQEAKNELLDRRRELGATNERMEALVEKLYAGRDHGMELAGAVGAYQRIAAASVGPPRPPALPGAAAAPAGPPGPGGGGGALVQARVSGVHHAASGGSNPGHGPRLPQQPGRRQQPQQRPRPAAEPPLLLQQPQRQQQQWQQQLQTVPDPFLMPLPTAMAAEPFHGGIGVWHQQSFPPPPPPLPPNVHSRPRAAAKAPLAPTRQLASTPGAGKKPPRHHESPLPQASPMAVDPPPPSAAASKLPALAGRSLPASRPHGRAPARGAASLVAGRGAGHSSSGGASPTRCATLPGGSDYGSVPSRLYESAAAYSAREGAAAKRRLEARAAAAGRPSDRFADTARTAGMLAAISAKWQ